MERVPKSVFTKEFKEEAVKMVTEGGLGIPEVGRRLSIPKSTLAYWVKVAKEGTLDTSRKQRPVTGEEMELARLKREITELKMERDILKKAAGVLCQGVAARYAIMKILRLTYPLPLICRVLETSRSGYYAWLSRSPSRRTQEEGRLEVEIKAAHKRTRGTCGPERLQRDLAAHGVKVGISRIRRLRKKFGIRCKQIKKFKATTDSNHTLPVAENLINQQFEAASPNQIWVSDITYIPTEEGWLYLAGHKDIFTKEVVGYAMGPRITKGLVSQSLIRAVSAKRPDKGLIHHSDRGSQYCSSDYVKLLEQFNMRASMSRKGNCYDNAPMESFWGTMKNELVYHQRYAARDEAIKEITEYIEVFYNRQRRQVRLGYLSPAAYEREFYARQLAA
ncbi:MAG: IS3 family transposase [Proteobacteria bacterium]|nr:IS3 family transposase [Pseudomonadota bacterium]